MNYGDTFLIKPKDRLFDRHLWVVISDPRTDAQRILIVNLTSWNRDKDGACILKPGDHPFIHHTTCVSYQDAKIVRDGFLEQGLRSGLIFPQEPASDDLVEAIIRGAGISQFLPLGCRDVLVQQKLLDE